MLQASQFADWLTAPSPALGPLLASVPRPALRWHAVGPAVGNPRNEGPSLVAPVVSP